ncbi:MAG TPA: hypothetical protein VEQ63_16425, partial [Bryobacteraceae bacterium]|nr:hypothetical protein [Bryobacteraceae bacterium]
MDRGQLGFLTLPWSRGVCVLDERTLIITGDHTALAFSQAPFGDLAKLLDGTRTRAALFLEAQSFATEAELESMLAELAGANCLITIPSGPRSAAEIIELSGGPATDTPFLEVSVMSVGGVMSGHVEELLTGSGLLLSPSAPLGIVLVDDYLRPGTREAIERLVSEGRSCLLCSPYGASPKLG